jgi:hypothetical protein
MDVAARNALIAELLNAGDSLSEVQSVLQDEHGIKLTYMELRLIAAELDVDWSTQDESGSTEAATEANAVAAVEAAAEGGAADAPGTTQVSISQVVRPGAVFSGDVTFKSGAKAEWYVDQLGRLGLNPTEGSGKPTPEDLQDFQRELQKLLQG